MPRRTENSVGVAGQESDLRQMTYLVTGGAGFIGSHLADRLLAQGARVIAIDNLSTGRRANIEHLSEQSDFEFHHGDISDQTLVLDLASNVDCIVHLAAAVGVQLIVERPVQTIETNIMGTEVVLKAGREHGCRVLVASSSEVYGKGSRIPFREDDDVILGPTSRSRWAYGASKMIDEFLAMAYAREYGLETVCFRLFNTVGPRQTGRYGMVVPRFVRQALSGESLTVYGDGSQSRCFMDVRDAVAAITALAGADAANGQIFNIGSTDEITILDLAKLVRRITGSSSEIVYVPYDEAYAPGFEDMERRVPEIGRLRELTGWKPSHDLEQTLHDVMIHESQ